MTEAGKYNISMQLMLFLSLVLQEFCLDLNPLKKTGSGVVPLEYLKFEWIGGQGWCWRRSGILGGGEGIIENWVS